MSDNTPDSPPPPPPPVLQVEPTPPPAGPSSDDKMMALLAHLLAIPCGFVGPLIIWLIKKDQSAFVAYHGKESLNFQITVMIASFVMLFLAIIPLVGCLTFPCFIGIGICDLVLCVIAGMKANEGAEYRYPFNLRLIK